MISAIVLAAGEAKRMGELKQLLPFKGSTIIEQVMGNLLKSKVDEVIVVLGYQAQRIAPKIAAKPVKIAVNPDFAAGMSSSVKCGLSQTTEGADILLALGDQPLIDEGVINRLIEMNCKSRCGIIAPVYNGIRGNPVIFKARYKEELLKQTGDVGGREIIKAHPEDVLPVAVESEGVIRDIDSRDDYQLLVCQTTLKGGENWRELPKA
jgi:molybdenum cofactor cytidylyltransferase